MKRLFLDTLSLSIKPPDFRLAKYLSHLPCQVESFVQETYLGHWSLFQFNIRKHKSHFCISIQYRIAITIWAGTIQYQLTLILFFGHIFSAHTWTHEHFTFSRVHTLKLPNSYRVNFVKYFYPIGYSSRAKNPTTSSIAVLFLVAPFWCMHTRKSLKCLAQKNTSPFNLWIERWYFLREGL